MCVPSFECDNWFVGFAFCCLRQVAAYLPRLDAGTLSHLSHHFSISSRLRGDAAHAALNALSSAVARQGLTGRGRFDTVTTQERLFFLLLINTVQLCVCKNKAGDVSAFALDTFEWPSHMWRPPATRVSSLRKGRCSESADVLSVCCCQRIEQNK